MFLKLFTLFSYALLANCDSPIAEEVEFHYYSEPTVKEVLKLNDAPALEKSKLKKSTQTVLIIDGFMSYGESNMSQLTKNALLAAKGAEVNTIVVDWGAFSGHGRLKNLSEIQELYKEVCMSLGAVSQRVAEFVNFLKTNKAIEFSQFHIIGLSLGAHIGGAVGMIIQQFKGTLGRISGEDPAGPGFSDQQDLKLRLDKSDATFVDIYHSNRGVLGDTALDKGHVHVFLNGGSKQPGCEKIDETGPLNGLCSHSFSYMFYNMCFTTPLKGCPCSGADCESSAPTKCDNGVRLGYDIPTSTAGSYSISTPAS